MTEGEPRPVLLRPRHYAKPIFEASELLKMVRKKGLWGVPDNTLKMLAAR